MIKSSPLHRERNLHVYHKGQIIAKADPVVFETQLHLLVNDEPWADLACSPQALKELAVGYLLSEKVLQDYSDLITIEYDDPQQKIYIRTSATAPARKLNYQQVNSCAGKGQQGLQTNGAGIAPVSAKNVYFHPEQIFTPVTEMEKAGETFRLTGGTHIAALGDQGRLLVSLEDIGRHNAVDKLLGHALPQEIPLIDKCLVLSGRIAAEILLKAAYRSVPLVISRSAATGMAVDLAEKLGITLIGFTRGDKFNIYCHPERIKV